MIKQILYPVVEMDILRLELTEEEQKQFDSFTVEQKVDFIIKNAGVDVHLSTHRQLMIEFYTAGLDKFSLQGGICKECGCTHHDPCRHPEYDTCWWENEDQNLCSHCANPEIRNDPMTERPEGVKKAIF